MTSDLQTQLTQLRRTIQGYGSALIAYSGGVDSTLVAAIAHEQLHDGALACIGASPSLPARELDQAVLMAEQIGIRYRVLKTEEHLDERYSINASDRCFFCKSHLFSRLKEIARREGWREVLDGVHADDLPDHQHGMHASREHGVRSPLLESGLGKSSVRAIARELGLPVWDKPAAPCLSSRIPRGTPITAELLLQVERAENVLADLGFGDFRVRHHGELARIELSPEQIPRAIQHRELILTGLRRAGYRWVTLDLAGLHGKSDAALVPLHVSISGDSR